MDLELPAELRCVPSALVALAGLSPDSSALHRDLWRRFTGGGGNLEAQVDRRMPLRFIDAAHVEFPPMKPKRNSYEWFIPKGILKKNWSASSV